MQLSKNKLTEYLHITLTARYYGTKGNKILPSVSHTHVCTHRHRHKYFENFYYKRKAFNSVFEESKDREMNYTFKCRKVIRSRMGPLSDFQSSAQPKTRQSTVLSRTI